MSIPITTNYICQYLFIPEWKQAVRVKCPAQENNTFFSARARGQTAQNNNKKEIQKSSYKLFTKIAYKF